MKRLILTAVAASMLALPIATADAAPRAGSYERAHRDVQVERNIVIKKKTEKRYGWQRGAKYRDWKRHQAVRDWHRYGLYRPGRGQQWIRVGNDYLLVGVVSGLIAGIVAGR